MPSELSSSSNCPLLHARSASSTTVLAGSPDQAPRIAACASSWRWRVGGIRFTARPASPSAPGIVLPARQQLRGAPGGGVMHADCTPIPASAAAWRRGTSSPRIATTRASAAAFLAPAGSLSRPISARTAGGAVASSESRHVAGSDARSASSSLRATPNATRARARHRRRAAPASRARGRRRASFVQPRLAHPRMTLEQQRGAQSVGCCLENRSISCRGTSRSTSPELPRCARPRRSGASRTGSRTPIYPKDGALSASAVRETRIPGVHPGANDGEGTRSLPRGVRGRAQIHLVIEPGSEPIRGTLVGSTVSRAASVAGSSWSRRSSGCGALQIRAQRGLPPDTVNRCVRTQLDPVRSARGR